MASAFGNRRQVLSGLMKLLVFVGLIFISIPFISSFSSSSIDEKQASKNNWVITLPVTELVAGEIKKLPWAGGVFWIYSRTKTDIKSLAKLDTLLRDKDSANSDQPDSMKSRYRSANENYFVFIPQESKRGCQVSLVSDAEPVLFTEPCFNGKFDAAGRVFADSGNKEQLNLAVPKHSVEDGVLKIAAWIPKI